MDSLIPILIVVAFAVVVLTAILKKKGFGSNFYQPQSELLSPAELNFLAALDQAAAPGQRVFAKVRLGDLTALKQGLSPKLRQIALNRIAQKHIDFVLCSGKSLASICAIELNDSSHDSSKAKQRDDFVASVCKQAALPLLVVKAARSYDPATLRQQMQNALQPEGARSVA